MWKGRSKRNLANLSALINPHFIGMEGNEWNKSCSPSLNVVCVSLCVHASDMLCFCQMVKRTGDEEVGSIKCLISSMLTIAKLGWNFIPLLTFPPY